MQSLVRDLFQTIECARSNSLPTLSVWSASPARFINQTHPQSDPDAVSGMGSGAQISARIDALLAATECRTLIPSTLSKTQKRAIQELVAEFYRSHQNQPALFLLHPCLMPNRSIHRIFLGGDVESQPDYQFGKNEERVRLRFDFRRFRSMSLRVRSFNWLLPDGLGQRDVQLVKVVERVRCLDPLGASRTGFYREHVSPAPLRPNRIDEELLVSGVAPAARKFLYSIWQNAETGMFSVHPKGWRDPQGKLRCVNDVGVLDVVLFKFWRFYLANTLPGQQELFTETLLLGLERSHGRVVQIVCNSGPCPDTEYRQDTCIGTAFRSVL